MSERGKSMTSLPIKVKKRLPWNEKRSSQRIEKATNKK